MKEESLESAWRFNYQKKSRHGVLLFGCRRLTYVLHKGVEGKVPTAINNMIRGG